MNSSDYRQTLRTSFVKFPEKFQINFLQEDVPDPQLLARYYDQSYVSDTKYTFKKSIFNELIDSILNLMDKVKIINPQSTWLLFWNFFILLAILYNLFQIPIAIFLTQRVYATQFQVHMRQLKTPLGIAINAIFLIGLFVDIFLVRPSIGFYISGKLTASHRQIMRKYLFLQFQFDLIAWIALLAYAVSNNSKFIYAKIIFYLYFLTLYRVDSQICAKIELLRLRFAFYKLMRVIFIMLFIVLWLSCIYFAIDYSYYLAQNQYYPVNLWLTNSQCSQYQGAKKFINLVQMYDWYVWLNYAFYWTLQSISMVGYGDMTPRNPPQVAYCDLVVLLMTIMYAFFINAVWQIIAQASELQNIEQNNRKNLMKYRKTYEIEGSMLNKLGSYMFQMWKHGKTQQIQDQINTSLTQDLRNELLQAKQKKFFWGIGLFDQLALISQQTTQLFRQWSYLIRQKKFGQNEMIFKSDQIAQNIYSIVVGEAKVEYPNSYIFNKKFQKTTFGLYKFFVEEKYGYYCQTITFNKVSCLSRQNFISTLKLYPNLYEKYRQLIEEMILYKNYEKTGEQCWICSSIEHLTNHCPQLFSFQNQIRENYMIGVRKKRGEYNHDKRQEKWLKNIRRYTARKNMEKTKIINKNSPFQFIELDQVRYYKDYRPQRNI